MAKCCLFSWFVYIKEKYSNTANVNTLGRYALLQTRSADEKLRLFIYAYM